MKGLPLVSIIIPTLNAESYLPYYFAQLKKQTYDKKKLEIVLADGGSTDGTLKIARKFGAKIVNNPFIQGQPGVFVGMQHAKGELLMILPGDNIFKSKEAIEKMVNIFMQDSAIYAAFPKHISASKDSLFTKYINTFTDPFNHFLYGKGSNARTFKDIYKTLENNSSYDIYDFSSSRIRPILGLTQGMTIRKNFARKWSEKYDDIVPILKLIKENKKIAYAHSIELYHHTVRDLEHYFRKQRWAAMNAFKKNSYGLNLRRELLTNEQRIKMFLFPAYSFSIVLPLAYSMFMFVKERKPIWLFHLVISFVTSTAIMYEFLRFKLGFYSDVSRL